MWNKLVLFLGEKLITAVIAMVVDYVAELKHNKEVKKQVKKVVKETRDAPEERARRIGDMLNS